MFSFMYDNSEAIELPAIPIFERFSDIDCEESLSRFGGEVAKLLGEMKNFYCILLNLLQTFWRST